MGSLCTTVCPTLLYLELLPAKCLRWSSGALLQFDQHPADKLVHVKYDINLQEPQGTLSDHADMKAVMGYFES